MNAVILIMESSQKRRVKNVNLGLDPDLDGRLSVEKVALLSGHEGEV